MSVIGEDRIKPKMKCCSFKLISSDNILSGKGIVLLNIAIQLSYANQSSLSGEHFVLLSSIH